MKIDPRGHAGPRKVKSLPLESRQSQKETVIFQASFFRCKITHSGGGGIKPDANVSGDFEGLPLNSALFGLVSCNDPRG